MMMFGPTHPSAPWPHFDKADQEAAAKVLATGQVNQWTGPYVQDFERAFASYCGAKHAVALANGTVALELALRALHGRIPNHGTVVVPSATFIGTATAVVAAGYVPLFADVHADTHGMTAQSLRAAAKADTVAVIIVHYGGIPVELDEIIDVCREKGWILIEDCAQAHGAKYRGKVVGTIGDIGCFSFCQDKILTTAGEGGCVITNDDELAERMWSYKDHGKNPKRIFGVDHPPGFRWVNDYWGTNWRLSSVQAAVGLSQLAKLDTWLGIRAANSGILRKELAQVEAIRLSPQRSHVENAYYKFYAYAEHLPQGSDRNDVIKAMNDAGVPVTVGSASEIYRELCVVESGWAPKNPLPIANRLARTSLCFQVHPTISKAHMTEIAAKAAAAIESVTRPR